MLNCCRKISTTYSDKSFMNLEDILKALDLKAEDTKIYCHLLEKGVHTAGTLAKVLDMPRPTLYGYLERLCEIGVVTQGLEKNVKVFSAAHPKKLDVLYTRKIEDIRAKQNSFQNLLPELESKIGQSGLRPKMEVYAGIDGIQSMLEDIFNYPETKMQAFFPIKSVLDLITPEFFRYHNVERIKRNIYIEGIWPRSQAVEIRRYPFMGWGGNFHREIRLAPDRIDSSMGYWVYGNRVIFISSRAESFGFIIESAELKQMMRTQHAMIWDQSVPVPMKEADVQRFWDELEEESQY